MNKNISKQNYFTFKIYLDVWMKFVGIRGGAKWENN